MKREDMGKFIARFLENYDKPHGLFGRKNDLAFDLLSHIEDLGMKPPRNNKHASDEDRSPVYQWEKEDWESNEEK